MDSPAKLQLDNILAYSDRYDFPLTLDEVWLWQINTSLTKSSIKKILSNSKYHPRDSFYFLPGRSGLIRTRRLRYATSTKKWSIARSVAESLSRLPTVEAIFVTGALAMNNSPADDDIDIMIITKPHTLWFTRFLIYIYLHLHLHIRRPTSLPEHSSPRVSNTICDNLYLETKNLKLIHKNLYIAHELLQAKCIFDRSNIAYRLLLENVWAGDHLPVAYHESLKKSPNRKFKNDSKFQFWYLVIWPINFLLFIGQYLHMKPKITSESISLHRAFFHPSKNLLTKKY